MRSLLSKNVIFFLRDAASPLASYIEQYGGNEMASTSSRSIAPIKWLLNRAFERLQRARLADIERSLSSTSNERELSQRVHRLESGDVPFSAT
jgi:hypothetical protein